MFWPCIVVRCRRASLRVLSIIFASLSHEATTAFSQEFEEAYIKTDRQSNLMSNLRQAALASWHLGSPGGRR
ncbi:hypothetical protein F4781DRAFT_390900 [Annulohypoxylon bovei var. microspora]|nr:hypothetical protein F4781DRAFT_390900 [Annulohypoxylon bovei var. microspora]